MRSSRSRWVAAAALGILLTWPLLRAPWRLLGHPEGEARNHLWMFWRALQEGPVSNLPRGLSLSLMDPVSGLWVWPGLLLEPSLGYLSLVLGSLALAFWGAWSLARALDLDAEACRFAGLACCSAPFLAGVMDFGITESWGLGWVGVHGAALIRWGRGGARGSLLLAGLSLAALAYSGWYMASFALWLEPFWLLLAWRAGGRERGRAFWIGGLLQGALALGLIWPWWLAFQEVQSFWEGRWRAPSAVPGAPAEPWWAGRQGGADLLQLFLPVSPSESPSRTVYLGWVPLLLALRAWRKSWPWLLLASTLWLAALGPWIRAGGSPLLRGPAWWLSQEGAPLTGLSHWYRALGPSLPLLALAAAMGLPQSRAWRAGLAALLVLESLALGGAPFPRRTLDPRPPELLRQIPGDEGLVMLPAPRAGDPLPGETPRQLDGWQPWLDRPLTGSYESPDAGRARSRFLAAAAALAEGRPPRSGTLEDPAPLSSPAVWSRERARLKDWGLGWVVLWGAAGRQAELHSLLGQLCGEPEMQEGDLVVYKIP